MDVRLYAHVISGILILPMGLSMRSRDQIEYNPGITRKDIINEQFWSEKRQKKISAEFGSINNEVKMLKVEVKGSRIIFT